MNKRTKIIGEIKQNYDKEEIIDIVTELLNNISINNWNTRISESRESGQTHFESDREGRIIRIGDIVQAQTAVRGRYPKGTVVGFTSRML